jgi:rubrerythrin
MSKNEIILNLKTCLDIEYKALEGYQDFIKSIRDKVDQDKIEMIIEDEKKHVKIVERLINLVNSAK